MCKLVTIEIPVMTPPPIGPWRVRWTRPDGDTALGVVSYTQLADADLDAERCRRICREGCTYHVVTDPDPSSATIVV